MCGEILRCAQDDGEVECEERFFAYAQNDRRVLRMTGKVNMAAFNMSKLIFIILVLQEQF